MKKITIVYHANCADGTMSALLLLNCLYALEPEEIVSSSVVSFIDYPVEDGSFLQVEQTKAETFIINLVPMSYNMDTSEVISALKDVVNDSTVYFVDFCLSVSSLNDLHEIANSIIVLDHHKTAEDNLYSKELNTKINFIFDMNLSGVGVVDTYIKAHYPDIHTPLSYLAKRVQDRDLWQFQYSDTKSILSWFYHVINTTKGINEILCDPSIDYVLFSSKFPEQYRKIGEVLLEERKARCKSTAKHSFIIEDPLFVLEIINCPMDIASETLEILYSTSIESRHPNCRQPDVYLAYIDSTTDRKWSVRNTYGLNTDLPKPSISARAFAEMFGGGGHDRAAGFLTTKDFPAEEILSHIDLVSLVKMATKK